MTPELFDKARVLREQIEQYSQLENFLANRDTLKPCITLYVMTAKGQESMPIKDVQAETLLQLIRRNLAQSKEDFIKL